MLRDRESYINLFLILRSAYDNIIIFNFIIFFKFLDNIKRD